MFNMRGWKSKEQRVARRAEIEQHDRAHAAQLAALNAARPRRPLFCQNTMPSSSRLPSDVTIAAAMI